MEAQAEITEHTQTELQRVQALEGRYLMNTYARSPVLFVRGKNSTLFDDQGRAYLDFISGIGVNVLGYDHPRIRRVLRDASKLMHTSNLFYHPYQGPLAERLAAASGMSRVFFSNTGSESIEGALKLARAWQWRQGRNNQTRFVALTNSFHGRTMGALSITAQKKYRDPFEPLVPGAMFVDPDDSKDGYAAARAAVNEETAAVVIETIQGESGVRPVAPEFLSAIREACDRAGALLILDEVQCGLGRTGKTFAFENTAARPDILCVAKPLGLGVPLGAFLANERAMDGLQPGDHGSTFGGGPLACRLSLEFLEMLDEGDLLKRINDVGGFFKRELEKMKRRQKQYISEVRGLGMILGLELKFSGKSVTRKMLERGFVFNCTHETVLRFLPPYIIKRSEVRQLLTALEETIVEEGALSKA
jgi:acetylornithine/N-succinyldiaminopimelate aminotransferase